MNKFLISFVLLFLFSQANSQKKDWRNTVMSNGGDYYKIVEETRKLLLPLKDKTDRKSKKQIKQFERWANFWKSRILPDGSFVSPSHNYYEWKKENERLKNQNNKEVEGPLWTFLGPSTPPSTSSTFYPGMGRVNTLAISKSNSNTMYAGSPSGGVWKTTDGGNTWTAKGDNFPNMGVSHIVIDPTNENILYLATGDFDGVQNPSLGVLKSIDAGETWSLTGLVFKNNDTLLISKLLIDPQNTNIILATTQHSIKRSADGGTTWSDVYSKNSANFNDIEYKTGSNTIIYATSRTGNFLKSSDNGVTWSLESTPASNRLDIAQTANDPNLILSLDEDGVVKKSTNEGSSWTTVSTVANYDSQGGYNMSIAISPTNKNLVLVGGVEGWRSKDGGATWEKYLDGYWVVGEPYFYVHSDHHDMLFIPATNTAFSCNDGGIFKGDASLNTAWTDLSNGLAITQYYNVAGTPQDAGKLIAGAQDNDIAVYTNGSWIARNDGSDGVEALWDYSNSKIAYTCSQEGTLERTIDGFISSEELLTPRGAPFVWQLEMHPTTPSTIYGGFSDIYKSVDKGDNWSSLTANISEIEAITIAPSNPDIIYVSGSNGLKKTTNGGTSWTKVTTPRVSVVKSVAINATNPNEIYIVFQGYTTQGRVYKSTDSGVNWIDISGSLPNVPTNKIIYKTGTSSEELFLANDLGVYYKNNTLNDWVKLDNKLPNVIISDLAIHYSTNKLRIATFGRGLWETTIKNVLGLNTSNLAKTTITLYPNPTENKTFKLDLSNLNGESTVLIYNSVGGVVKNLKTTNKTEVFNLSGYSKGVYFVKITNSEKTTTKKLILQ